MVRRAAEVDVRPVEWHRGRHNRYQGGGVARRVAEVDVRRVEWHRGWLRSLLGRWSDTEGG